MADNLFTGAISNNWAVAGNWSQGSIPTATDTYTTRFDATSPNCTLGGSRTCNHINFTGYTGTLTMSTNSLSVSGNITLDTGLVVSGTGTLIANDTGSLTSNGYSWANGFSFNGTSKTFTLQDNWTVLGTVSVAGTTACTINNNGTAKTFYCSGGLSVATSNSSGTAKFIMNGTGTLTASTYMQNDFEINTAGTITIGSAWRYSTGTFTYTAGTVDTTTNSSTFHIGLTSTTTTTLATNGITWNNITTANSCTITLSNALTCTGTFTSSGNITLNSSTLYLQGSSSWGGSNPMAGTTVCEFSGSNPSWTSGTGSLRLTTNINCSGTFTMSGANNYGTNTLTYAAGTISAATSTLTLSASCTLNLGAGNTYGGMNIATGSITITLSTDIHLSGTFACNGNNSALSGAYKIYVGGSFTWNNSTVAGGSNTVEFVLDGTGTWSTTGGAVCSNKVTINTAGTITMGTTVGYRTGTLKYIAGTVITTSSTFSPSSCTLDTNGITWNNIALTTAGTLTLTSALTCSGTLSFTTNQTFAGAAGFTCATLSCTTVNRSMTLKAGNTYTVTTSIALIGTGIAASSNVRILSDTPSSYAFLNLQTGATCYNKYCTATDIDSSGGRLVTSDKGALTRTINWYVTNPDNYYLF